MKTNIGIGTATPSYNYHCAETLGDDTLEDLEHPLLNLEHPLLTADENAPFLLCISGFHSRARLIILPNIFHIEMRQQPNIWVRFWQRFFLGWRWEAIEEMSEFDERKDNDGK